MTAFIHADFHATVAAPTSGAGLGETNDTLTLGGVRYADLRLAHSGSDLFVKVAGTADSIKFTGWYSASGNRTVATLQLIVDSTADYNAGSADLLVNRRVVRLNFTSLVNAFDSAYAASPAIGDWAVPVATLSSAFLAGSDTQAVGGGLAYHYGRDGNLGALDFATGSTVLGDANFATSAQSFGTAPAAGGVRLMSAGQLVEETTASAAPILEAPMAGEEGSLQDEGAAALPDEGDARLPLGVQGLVEDWAAGLIESTGADGVPYLTPDHWTVAADAVDRSGAFASGAGQFEAGFATQGPSPFGAAPAGAADSAFASAMAGRWAAVDRTMLGLDASGTGLPGGEPIDLRGALGEWPGSDMLPVGISAQARQPQARSAMY